MKKTKVLLTLACAILLVAASVMGTLAWLTDASAVKNTFTVGNIHFDDKNGLHGLDEADVNLNGQPLDEDGNVTTDKSESPRVVENTYKLVPGHEYTKDPIIHVAAGSEDCYLFVKVTNEIAAIEDTKTEGKKTIAQQMDDLGWKQVEDDNGNPIPGVYMLKESDNGEWVKKVVTTSATANTDVTVFEYFKLADDADVSDYEGKSIKVIAYAVQVDGFENASAYEIWNSVFAGKADPEVPSETTVATEPAVIDPVGE